ncbi:hypothetical protein NPIL_111101 [Nephila pilipes]|uniref:Uncharacterized protein n=1 Tax=Nephila pilipes TaxID=299642 RepID=A0A8X6NTV7_NEPPI|nr:hypothetical protein NPIL_111101 [Nephila pilipes]
MEGRSTEEITDTKINRYHIQHRPMKIDLKSAHANFTADGRREPAAERQLSGKCCLAVRRKPVREEKQEATSL